MDDFEGSLDLNGHGSWVVCKALHWVPIPMPAHAHGFWVGMGAILLFMSGHGWACV